jgi:hypothetical protein
MSHRRSPRCRPSWLWVCALTACGAGWHRPAAVDPGQWPPRQQVQVWSGTHSRQWHAVVVTSDSISGIPFQQPVSCDGCRQSLGRSAVDSVRAGDPMAGFWKTAVLMVALPIGILAVLCGGTNGGCNPGN